MGILTFGQTIFCIGICLVAAGIMSVILGNILLSVKRRKIKKKLTDKYGF